MLNNKGMTLVELIVTFSILLVLVIGLYNLILEVKFQVDDQQIAKELTEYTSSFNDEIHYDLITNKPLAILVKNRANSEFECATSTGVASDCQPFPGYEEFQDALFKVKIDGKIYNFASEYLPKQGTNNYEPIKKNCPTATSCVNFDDMCKGIYPCALYYYKDSSNKLTTKVIALNKESVVDSNATEEELLKNDWKNVKGILYGDATTATGTYFEPVPNNDYVEIRDAELYVEDDSGNLVKETNDEDKLYIKIENNVLIINFSAYVIDDDINHGFKIAYPISYK